MRIRELKREARESLKGNWGVAIGVFLVFSVLIGAITSPDIVEPSSFTLSWVPVLSFLIAIPLEAGVNWFYLDIYDGKNVEFKQMFDGFKYFGKILGAGLLVCLYTFLWSLLFIVPGIIKSISYSQTLFVIRDNPEIGIKDAIRESQLMMDGYKWTYLLVNLSFLGWYLIPYVGIIIGALMVFVGQAVIFSLIILVISLVAIIGVSFYLFPYYLTTLAGFYRKLTKNSLN